jgi:hypothetical protein
MPSARLGAAKMRFCGLQDGVTLQDTDLCARDEQRYHRKSELR